MNRGQSATEEEGAKLGDCPSREVCCVLWFCGPVDTRTEKEGDGGIPNGQWQRKRPSMVEKGCATISCGRECVSLG